jgi:hypothetical protein
MDNLASVLGNQGKYEQAEEIHRQALGCRAYLGMFAHRPAYQSREFSRCWEMFTERYVWIDIFCIPQDCPFAKAREVDNQA